MSAERGSLLAGYLREDELAKELGRSTKTLARWRALRVGPPSVRNGREFWYDMAAARAWLAAGGSLRKSGRSKTR
jgi:hypothetical protein